MVRKMRHKKSYDENELKRLVESGKTRKKIAEILGISESAVDVGIRQQGLNGKNSRKKYNKELLEKYLEEGKTSREIADLMGVTRECVNKWIKKEGLIGTKQPGRRKTKTERAIELAKQGYTAQEIADMAGVSMSIVYLALHKPGDEKMNSDRHLCRKCKYRAKTKGCDYYMLTGKERMLICEVEECTVFEEGERLKGEDE